VHDFPWSAAVAAIDAAISGVTPDAPHVALLYVCVAMLLILWPVRPHTLLSCRVADVSSDGTFWYFTPREHKRKPTDAVFAVRLPEGWA
jgi:hypothetical protein